MQPTPQERHPCFQLTKETPSQRTTKRRPLSQIRHQIIHTIQKPPQQLLLLSRRPRHLTRTIRPLPPRILASKRSGQFTGTPLQHARVVGRGNRRCFGHEVEVEELDEFFLDFSGCFAGFEGRGYGEEAFEGFEGAGVLGGVDEGADEGYDGCGLDGWTPHWFEEVEELLLNPDISI